MRIEPPSTPVTTHYSNPLEAFWMLKKNHPEWWQASPRESADRRYPWPQNMSPNEAKVFAHNVIEIPNATPKEVFAVLTDAKNWPTYYPNADHVQLPAGKQQLEAGMSFQWTTFGTSQKSTVLQFKPGELLAWDARSLGTRAYHRWILERHGSGTRVTTEETQVGTVAWLDHAVMNPGLHAAHQLWLTGLERFISAQPERQSKVR